MDFSIFKFGFKLTFRSVYIYHLVLLIYMGLAQDNTVLTNLGRLLWRKGGAALWFSFSKLSCCHLGHGEMLPPTICTQKNFFVVNSVPSGKMQRGFPPHLTAQSFLNGSDMIQMKMCFPGDKATCCNI